MEVISFIENLRIIRKKIPTNEANQQYNRFKNRKFKEMNYIWQYPNWTNFKWDDKILLKELAQARLALGKIDH